MSFPNWYGLFLLSLASFRTWRIVGEDSISDRIRDRIGGGVQMFLECPWCSGFWIATMWWAAFQVWPLGTTIVAVPFAIAAIAGLLGYLI